jgi:hypothetical protein
MLFLLAFNVMVYNFLNFYFNFDLIGKSKWNSKVCQKTKKIVKPNYILEYKNIRLPKQYLLSMFFILNILKCIKICWLV